VGEARKHHYVPVFYQAHFANSKGLLWVYDRRLKTYKELHPRVICFQSDLYTLKRKDGPSERRVESQLLSLVDGLGSSAIRNILSGNRTREAVQALAYFIGVQIHRLPSFARQISELYVSSAEEMMRLMSVDVGRMQSVIERVQEAGKSIDVSAESMVDAIREKQIEVVATEVPFLSHIFGQAESISDVLEGLDWQILVAPHTTGFIICDDPVVVVPPAGCASVGFLVPGTVSYFPLTRKFCLRLCSTKSSIYRKISKETVQAVNYNIAAHSERFVMGPDKAQLVSSVLESGGSEEASVPRYTIEMLNQDDSGSFQKLTIHPGRYFYLKGSAP
jgi:hypothetical protein